MSALHEDSELGQWLHRQIVASRIAPHAVCGYAWRSQGAWRLVGGCAHDSSLSQVFDLASISKPFTALSAARLVQSGQWCFGDRLQKSLPELQGTPTGESTLEELLSHRARLKAHVQLFRKSWAHQSFDVRELIGRAARARSMGHEPSALYSDLGYILVGKALESALSRPLDHVIEKLVCQPWGLRVGSARAFLAKEPDFRSRVAPTEIQRFRGGVLRGMVHDDNAWVLSGTGCSGHAGLFGDLEALLKFGARVLSALSDRELAPLVVPLIAQRPDSSLRMGFDGVSKQSSSAGSLAGPNTFGHLGFSGTSLWMDPDRGRVTVLLSNRVYPSRNNTRLKAVRAQIHDFLWQC